MKKLTAAVMALLLLTLCSCSGKTLEEEPQSADSAVTFTDALGREIALDKCPERTAALIGSFADV